MEVVGADWSGAKHPAQDATKRRELRHLVWMFRLHTRCIQFWLIADTAKEMKMSTAYVGALATGLALTEDERELIIQRRIKNVYREVPSIPQGYEFVDFRCTQSGDLFISASYGDRVLEHTQPDFTPRIIVRRKPEVKVKVVKFVPVIEDGVHAYRPLNHGEGFVLSDKGAGTFKGSASVVSYYVYRFVEEEVLASSLT